MASLMSNREDHVAITANLGALVIKKIMLISTRTKWNF